MNLIDITIVNVGLPTIQRNLGASSSDLEWMVAGYVLAFAIGLLPFGRLGDILGRHKVFLAGVIGFTLFSAGCGIAPSIDWLIAARVLQGLSASMMMPQTIAMVQVAFPPRERASVFALFGLNAGLAAVAGPIVGGLLITADIYGLDWRPIFLVNLPIGVAIVAASLFGLPRIAGHPGLRIDWPGMVFAAVALVCLVFPLVEGRGFGWPIWAFAMMAGFVPAAAAFLFWQRRQAHLGKSQLIPSNILSNRSFLVGAVMAMALFSAMPSFFMVFAIFLQSGFGFTAFESGFATSPMPLGIFVVSAIVGRLGGRYQRARLALGTLAVLAGYVWLRSVIVGVTDSVDHWQFAPSLFMVGAGIGLTIGALFQAALASIPPHDAGSGSGALQSFQQVGNALGVAIAGEIFFSTLMRGGTFSHASYVTAIGNAFYYEFGALALVLVLQAFLPRVPLHGLPGQDGTARAVPEI